MVAGGAGIVLAAVVVAAAGWWFFVREDNELATSAPEIPTELRDDGAASTSGAESGNRWVILAEQSEAAYFADEKLARLPLPSTAKGSTKRIEGEFHLTEDGLALDASKASRLTVDLTDLKSNEEMRDRRMHEAIESSRFPTATFTIANVSGYDPSMAEGEEQTLQMTGALDLHGVQRDVTWEVKARREGDVITALATTNFLYEDFNIPVLNIAGIVSVEEDVTLQVQIVAVPAAAG
jgi:polyisoprenoid-binding protein YceI